MNAVGIDVSKGKSTVTIHGAGNVVLMAPYLYESSGYHASFNVARKTAISSCQPVRSFGVSMMRGS